MSESSCVSSLALAALALAALALLLRVSIVSAQFIDCDDRCSCW